MNFLNFLRRQSQKISAPTPGALPASWAPYRQYIEVHPTALIGPSATVQFYNLPKTPRVMLKIGEMSHVFGHFAFLRDEASIEIGDRCQIGASHFISGTKITLGNDVIVSWGCSFIDTDNHAVAWEDRKNDVLECYADYMNDPRNMVATRAWKGVNFEPVHIGSRSWVGFNSIILKGVSLAENTVVGAGSVVPRSWDEPDFIIAGNPAKKVTSKSRHKS